MSTPGDISNEAAEEVDQPGPARELESALLSIVLFGGLVAFGLGCMLLGWN